LDLLFFFFFLRKLARLPETQRVISLSLSLSLYLNSITIRMLTQQQQKMNKSFHEPVEGKREGGRGLVN
jgi:hypothetical protein